MRPFLALALAVPLMTAPLVLAGAVPASAQEAETAPARGAQPPAIVAVRASVADITDRVLTNGMIMAVEEVLVAPQVEGLAIESLEADIGDQVEAGSVLATLSSDQLILQRSQLDANRAKALAAIAQLGAQLAEVQSTTQETVKTAERARQLADQGTYSTVQADQAEAQATAALARIRSVEESIKVAQADVTLIDAQIEDVELRLARTEVKAPVSGVITARGARVGAIASAASGPLFTMIKDGRLEMRADIAEADMHRIAEGQSVKIHLIGAAEPVSGKIRRIEPTLNTTTRLGLARIEIEDGAGLRAGMFADAQILVAQRQAITAPVTSINMGADGADVLKIEDGVATRTPVKTGIREGGRVEITEGLAEGDLIVAKAGAFVRNGDRVTPVEETDSGQVAAITE
ncbi:MAG: efflux RND transporter periplasmic adaptor subunit [Hoeflea sp.]|nr:efflux RND transporter periplasmic adaptor subunit [Alphaproteobacteria bacterium]MBV1723367.1 efflux RND transporter periplasmic adaptor subunit [Hoeflea sp.]MBU4544033.1 efflux RND transporter periplasmic adaptor subunit [Alphaproteobacteria bacterium]MBU4551902.1 efflux RND transporter periplasmic adaptor subunit [Alphaproteobacteria bacterium]MBV1760346.1 efflux RND transporter periplasmic adaptor subunit [Hoeflea sp.]